MNSPERISTTLPWASSRGLGLSHHPQVLRNLGSAAAWVQLQYQVQAELWIRPRGKRPQPGADPLHTKGPGTCRQTGDCTLRDTAEARDPRLWHLWLWGYKTPVFFVQSPSLEVPVQAIILLLSNLTKVKVFWGSGHLRLCYGKPRTEPVRTPGVTLWWREFHAISGGFRVTTRVDPGQTGQFP